jgi:predicted ATP-dependent endonuclease of OLD family
MEKITIKNFGPIQQAEIEVKDICVLIGHTSSGKSTIAKLLAIFNSLEFYCIIPSDDLSQFNSLLRSYNIDFKFRDETSIEYYKEPYRWTIGKEGLQTDYPYSDILFELSKNSNSPIWQPKIFMWYLSSIIERLNDNSKEMFKDKLKAIEQLPTKDFIQLQQFSSLSGQLIDRFYKGEQPVYIPAERILMSILSQVIYSLYDKDINLPASLKKFANLYSLAKRENDHYAIDFLNILVLFDNKKGNDGFILGSGDEVDLDQASSGLQSLIPMLSVFDYTLEDYKLLIIEEPELNLYTKVQKDLIEYLIKRAKQKQAKIIITTHSPYVMSTLQNLLQAGNIAKESDAKAAEVKKLIPPEKWIDYDDLTCLFMDADGTSRNILDPEYHTIGTNEMDDISAELSDIYDSLLEIKYHE